MPNIKSAEKRVRQTAKRRLRNRTRLVTTRNMMKKLRKMEDKAQAEAMLPELYRNLDRLANRNIIHKRTAANYKAKLTKFVATIGA